MGKLETFIRDQDGGATTDWVFLTAAVIGLTIAIVASVGTGERKISATIVSSIDDSQNAFAE